MVKFRKILVLALVLAVLAVGIIVTAVAADEYTGTVAEATALLDSVEEKTTTEEKVAFLGAYNKYILENPIDPESEGYDDLIARGEAISAALETRKLSEAKALFDAYAEKSEDDLGGRRTAFNKVQEYVAKFPINEQTEGYTEFKTAYDAAEKKLVEDEFKHYMSRVKESEEADVYTNLSTLFEYLDDHPVDDATAESLGLKNDLDTYEIKWVKYKLDTTVALENINTASNRIKLNNVNALAKKLVLNTEHADYAAYATAHAAATRAHEEQVRLNYEELERQAYFEEYAYSPTFNYVFDDDIKPSVNKNKAPNSWGKIDSGADGDNKYFTIYHDPADTGGYHVYAYKSITDKNAGFVFELDITTFGSWPNSGTEANVKSNGVSTSGSSQSNIYAKLFGIDGSGNLKSHSDSKTVYLSNVITPGEWIHITVVFNPNADSHDKRVSVYLDYELVGQHDPLSGTETFSFFEVRIGDTNKRGQYSIDNYYCYPGAHVRTDGKLDNLTEEETFVYYVDYIHQQDKPFDSILSIYETAKELLPKYYQDNGDTDKTNDYLTENQDVRGAVDRLLVFDLDALIENLKQSNLQLYVDTVEDIVAMGRTLANLSKRQSAVKKYDNIVKKIGDYIDQTQEEYQSASTKVLEITKQIEEDELIAAFISAVGKFEKAGTIASMTRRYNDATSYIPSLNFNMLDAVGFENFKTKYQTYLGAETRLAIAIRTDNSRKIVDCVNFIKEYDTEEEWEANFDLVNKYVLIIRSALRGDYDALYSGLEEAIAIFEPIDNYFYTKLQNGHISVISGQLEIYASTDSFIDKMAASAYIIRYLESNDIDYENAGIAALLQTHEANMAELVLREHEYAELLQQNTVYFVNLVEQLKACEGYDAIRKAYDAAAVYYYVINVGSDEVQEALDVFDEFTAQLEIAEEASKLFIAYASQFDALEAKGKLTDDAKYSLLVKCRGVYDDIEMSIDGVSEAVAKYIEVYDEYMSIVNQTNREIVETGVAVGSSRASTGVANVISVIIKFIFG